MQLINIILSLAKNNMLFNSSGVSTSLAHSHTLCNTYIWTLYAAMCQAVIFSSSLAKNNMLFNSGVRTSFAHSHSLCNTSVWLFSAVMCQALLSYLSFAKNMLFYSSCVSTYLPSPTVCVILLFGPPLLPSVRRSSHI